MIRQYAAPGVELGTPCLCPEELVCVGRGLRDLSPLFQASALQWLDSCEDISIVL